MFIPIPGKKEQEEILVIDEFISKQKKYVAENFKSGINLKFISSLDLDQFRSFIIDNLEDILNRLSGLQNLLNAKHGLLKRENFM